MAGEEEAVTREAQKPCSPQGELRGSELVGELGKGGGAKRTKTKR